MGFLRRLVSTRSQRKINPSRLTTLTDRGRTDRLAMWRSAALAGSYVLAFWLLSAGPAGARCGQECDGDYASAIDDCESLHGDDPADADELATCIQEARDDYRSCLDNCASDASPNRIKRRPAAILVRLETVITARQLAANLETLTAEDAAKHVGENATVCGVVASAHYAARSAGQPTFLNLDRSYPNQIFVAVVFGNDRTKFGEPERLQGKQVCVTGSIQLYRGTPEIILRDPRQLEQR
jgi:hypothetical protein